MANQIVVSAGAKVRNLDGVLTATSGVVSSVPLGAANGVATLDSGGKVPVSQLPSSVVTYLGTWNAATNTPTLVNGTGDAGDMYICNVAGTVNFGAGPVTFAVGDWVLYGSGTWQKSNGQNGTVTSVAASITGNSIGITGSPITTAGTLALAFAGTSGQYINGAGNLVTFPTIVTEAQRLVTEVYNETGATLTKGTVVYINGGHGNLPTVTKAIATGDATSAQTYGVVQTDITNMNNGYVVVIGSLMDLDTQAYPNGTQLYLSSTTAGAWTSTKQYAPAHLVYVAIVTRSHPTQGVVEVRIQNGFEMDELHNVSAQSPSNNQGLFYNTSTSLWENKSIATALGYTPADDSLVVHLAGTETITGEKTFTNVNGTQFDYGIVSPLTSRFDQGIIFKKGTVPTIFTTITTNLYSESTSNNLVIQDQNSKAKLIFNNSTQTYTFPAATGTISLTSDLAGYVPYTGATSNVNLGAYDLTSRLIKIDGSTNGGSLNIKQNATTILSGIGYNSISAKSDTSLQLYYGNATISTFRSVLLNVNNLIDGSTRTFEFPDANGTIALTSDIPSLSGYVQGTGTTNYLPKFTGASTIGNSAITDDGTTVSLISRALSGVTATFTHSSGDTITLSKGSGPTIKFSKTAATAQDWAIAGEGTAFKLYNYTAGTVPLMVDASGNLGLGVTPSAWDAYKAYQVGWGALASTTATQNTLLSSNVYFDGATFRYIGTGTASYLQQFEGSFIWKTAPSGTAGNAITFTQAMTLTAAGRLLIGTPTESTYLLDVNGTGRFTAPSGTQENITVKSANTGFSKIVIDAVTSASSQLAFLENGTQKGVVGYRPSTGNVFLANATGDILTIASTGAATFSSSVTAGDIFSTDGTRINFFGVGTGANVGYVGMTTNHALAFLTNNTEKMRITSGGNVGIGTSSPQAILSVKGATNNTVIEFDNGGATKAFMRSYDRTAGAYREYEMLANELLFSTGSSPTERIRITSGGNVLIGTTTDTYGSKLTGLLNDNGYVTTAIKQGTFGAAFLARVDNTNSDYVRFFYTSANTQTGSINTNGTTTTYNVTSDYRLKQDLKDYSGLDLISSIKTYDYEWKSDKSRMYGVVAHELQEVIPYAVQGEKDGLDENNKEKMQSVDYSKLVPILVKAIQELKAEIETLKIK